MSSIGCTAVVLFRLLCVIFDFRRDEWGTDCPNDATTNDGRQSKPTDDAAAAANAWWLSSNPTVWDRHFV